MPITINTPIVGRDAFRTATGVHAAAVIKARRKGEAWLADRVYSGVPAGWIGREQEIEIGPMSGLSNVNYYLASRDLPNDHELAQTILDTAKKSKQLLTDDEILELVHAFETS
jgi:2-isopropylmalate synthase